MRPKKKTAKPVEAPIKVRVISLQEMFEEEISLPQGYRLSNQEADVILKSAVQKAQTQEPPQEP